MKSRRLRCPNIHRKQRIRPLSLGNNKDKALFWFIAMRFLISLGRVFQPVSCSASGWLTSPGGAGLLSIGILSCLANAQRTVRFAKSLAHELEAQLIVLHAVPAAGDEATYNQDRVVRHAPRNHMSPTIRTLSRSLLHVHIRRLFGHIGILSCRITTGIHLRPD